MTLHPIDEAMFQKWYANLPRVKEGSLNPNPDDPEHFYDYRAAYMNGDGQDQTGHFPSKFKKLGNPRYTLNGVNTTDERPYPTANSLADLIGRMVE